MKRFPLLAVALATALLTGCASVVNPSSQVPTTTPTLAAAAEAGVTSGTPARDWWRAYNDPALNALVDESMMNNRDLRAALAAVSAARSLADAAARESLPAGRLEAQAMSQRPSVAEVDIYEQGLPRPPSARIATIGQGLAWEVDLFGRVGTASAAAQRRADSAAADLHGATALLQGEVVSHYIGLRLQQQTLDLLSQEAGEQMARAQQLRLRVEAGLADKREALAAEGEQRRLQVEAAQAEAAIHTHLASLAVLAGRSPSLQDAWHQTLRASGKLPQVPRSDALVQPSDLLARRPDVARADAQLRVAMGEAVLAERAHLPRLSLNLALGLNAPFGSLNESGAVRYAAGPALTWDWLDFGRIKAQAAAARAGQDAAVQVFEQAVLKALQDSEVAVRHWAASRSALATAMQAQDLAAQGVAHTRIRVEAGLEPPVLAREGAAVLLQATRGTLAAQAGALMAYGQAQLALGAWQPQAQAQAVAAR